MSKKLHLHLDADTSSKALHSALLTRGHDVTRTPTEWMPLNASDEQQLLGATAQGRAIFTYNIRDFISLGKALSASPRDYSCLPKKHEAE